MIRAFRRVDAPAVAELLRGGVDTAWIVNEQEVLHWEDLTPARARRASWVATEEDEIVGWVESQLRWEVGEEGVGELWGAVARGRRGRGYGSRLFAAAEAHLRDIGARKIQAWAEEEAAMRFLRARGFHETGRERISALDARTVDLSPLSDLEAAKRAEGFRTVPLRDVLDRPRDLYHLYIAGERAMPSIFTEGNVSFAEWERETLGSPNIERDGSFVVLAGERPAALALVKVDRQERRAANEMTATLPEFRRQGLARLAKLATIRWAAENGITAIVTENDDENVGMRALNEELGYRPVLVRRVFLRDA